MLPEAFNGDSSFTSDCRPVSRPVYLARDAVGGFEGGFLAPRHLSGVCAREVNSSNRTSDFRPEARQVAGLVSRSLTHAGPGIFGPVVHNHLFDIRRLALVELLKRC